MFTFPIPKPRHTKTCSQCHREFEGSDDHRICGECTFYQDHPDRAPGYWTWTRLTADTWGIAAYWPDTASHPQPNSSVTVHPRDVSSSNETIDRICDRVCEPV